jgi:peptidoglycan-N-acetylglucosamine deacetylase
MTASLPPQAPARIPGRRTTDPMQVRMPVALLALALAAVPAAAAPDAAPCPADALGTARVLPVDAATTPRLGRKHFAHTLALAPKEVVLTFDDGPEPGTTARILDALRRECARASFFLLGRNAQAHPQLARRELTEGHTVAHHTFSHPLLNHMPVAAAEAEIDRGFGAVDAALYRRFERVPKTPFFRFPGFASSAALLDRLERRGIVVFGADLWASDWDPMMPQQQLQLVLGRVEANRGGIVLFHDTKAQTAAMLPTFLRALKHRGYRVVHVVPASESGVSPAPVP